MSGSALAQSAPSAAPKTTIDPNTIKRRGVSFRGYDPSRAFEGYTFFAPTAPPNKTVYLIDMVGNVVHTWNMPYPPGCSGYLTPRGTLFYNGKIPNASHVGRAAYLGGAAMEVDWSGRVLWEVRNPEHDHDGLRLQNGNVLLVCARPLPAALVRRVRGGKPGSEQPGGGMDGDYLVEMTTDGRVVWEWRAWEHLDPATDAITAV